MLLSRPNTTVILAMSADGKIADYQRNSARFGSSADKNHLEHQIATADAVLLGGGTLRSYGSSLTITNPQLLQIRQQKQQPPQPIQIVCSASGNIYPKLRFFEQPFPRWLITTSEGARVWTNIYPDQFEDILIIQTKSGEIDWEKIFNELSNRNIRQLAILGGGELVASLWERDLIDQLWLTVCPLILGGKTAPTPVDGQGFGADAAKRLELLEVQTVASEIFLHYRVIH